MRLLKRETTRNFVVFMTSAQSHIAGQAGETLTIRLSKNGAAFATITPTVTDLGDGWYNLALTAAHTDTLGDFVLHVTSSGSDPTDLSAEIVAYDPQSATSLGLANLDVTVSSRLAAATYVAPDNAGIAANVTLSLLVSKLLRNRMVTDPVAGTITVFDDDNTTVLLTAPLYEDAAATQTYRGQGAERRNRMT